jgi:hypothetical protein
MLRSQGRFTLKTALLEQGPFPGLESPVSFDRYGDIERTPRMAVIHNGSFTPEQ